MKMDSYNSLMEYLKAQDQNTDWDNTYVLAENLLDGSYFNGEPIDRDDYYMVVEANKTINFMEYKEQRYVPVFTATVMHEERIVTIFGFTLLE